MTAMGRSGAAVTPPGPTSTSSGASSATPAAAPGRAPRSIALRGTTERLPRIEAVGRAFAPHRDAYHFILSRSWATFFVLLALAFLGANAVFALLYWSHPGSVSNARPGSFEDAFFFSVQTMATIGYGGMAPATRFAHVVVTLEALAGIISVALITGITFAKFARPTARVLFADKIALTPRNGVPHLIFRMANWRHNRIVEAQLRVTLLVTEKTREGETLRRQIDLPLVRDRTPQFALSWTAMHLIDAQSPFHGADATARLRAAGAEMFLTLVGVDEVMGQISARYSYQLDDIVPNVRFADVMSVLPDGTRRIDYRRFHEVVPIAQGDDGDGVGGAR
jgi:inward rectifier potassium channel